MRAAGGLFDLVAAGFERDAGRSDAGTNSDGGRIARAFGRFDGYPVSNRDAVSFTRSKKPGVVGLGRERRLLGFWRIVGDGDFNDLRLFGRLARWSCRLFDHTYSDHRLDEAASESSHRRR